jgi:hypothetical protein
MDEIATGWANFFTAEVGAAAALSGLIIVAVSINLQRILSFPQLPGRAALTACSFALMPGQPLKVLGGEILGAGLLMTGAPLVIQARQLPVMKTQPLTWWIWRSLVGVCAGLPVLIGGCVLISGTSGGLYWLAAGVLVTFAATVWNAWVLLVEILR